MFAYGYGYGCSLLGNCGVRQCIFDEVKLFFRIDMFDGLRDGGGRNFSSEFSPSHHRGVMLGWSHEAAESHSRERRLASLHCGHADVTDCEWIRHASVAGEQQ